MHLLMFMLPDEVCALFQSWNSCLNVTSIVSIFIHDDECLLFLFPQGFIQRHRLVLFTSKKTSLPWFVSFPHGKMGVFSCLTYAMNHCNHMIQKHQMKVGSLKSLLNPLKSVAATGDRPSLKLQAALKFGFFWTLLFCVILLVETYLHSVWEKKAFLIRKVQKCYLKNICKLKMVFHTCLFLHQYYTLLVSY